MKKVTTNEFITKASVIHTNKYDYSLVKYVRANNKIIILCPIHGKFEQIPMSHIKGFGCVQCGLEQRKQTKLEKYDDENFTNREKSKRTCLEKYGVEYPVQYPLFKTKMKQTMLDTYGVEHNSLNPETLGQRRQSCLEKYGVEYLLQNETIKNKMKQTMLDRYGVEYPQQSSQIRNKTKESTIIKYGINHHNQQHMINIFPLINDSSWLMDQYLFQNKTALQISQELSISDVILGKYLKKAEIEIKKFHQSFISKLWLQSIQEQEQIEIMYEYQWDKHNLRTKADGYCLETNTIYEFHGDYWHGNPEIYTSDIIHPIIRKPMGDLYIKTIEREQRIKSMGYNLVVMWESNFHLLHKETEC